MEKKLTILHILYVSENKASGVRNIVPQHLQYQSQFADVALLNCNDTEVEEAKGVYNVYKLSELKDKKIKNLPEPYNNPDLVVFHAIYYPQYINLYKQCKKEKIPYVLVPHGSLTKKAQRQKIIKKIFANLLLFNSFINNAEVIQYLVDGEKKDSRYEKKYIICGHGIKLTKKIKKYDKSSKENKPFIYEYIGRIDTYIKGLDLLIEAVNMVKEYVEKNNMKFMLYGPDYRGRRKKVERLIKKYELENIVFLNKPVWNEEKIDKLLEGDVFIQTSRSEGQPLGLMEAISVGLPCVVTKETNFGYIIENNNMGWQADANANDIAKKIIKAYECRSEYPIITKNEIEYAEDNFEWNHVAKETIEKYKMIVNEYKEKK